MHFSQTMMLGLALTGLFALTGFTARPVSAQELTYTLNNVTFSDGATASGYFDYDTSTDTFGAFDITTTNGPTDAQYGDSYVSGITYAYKSIFDARGRFGTTFSFLAQGNQRNVLVLDTYDVPGSSDILSLIPGTIVETSNLSNSGEFTYPPGVYTASIRGIISGSLGVPDAVPEASTTVSFGLLLALGMGRVVSAAKKKKAPAAA